MLQLWQPVATIGNCMLTPSSRQTCPSLDSTAQHLPQPGPTSCSTATTATGSVALIMAPNRKASGQLHSYGKKYLAHSAISRNCTTTPGQASTMICTVAVDYKEGHRADKQGVAASGPCWSTTECRTCRHCSPRTKTTKCVLQPSSSGEKPVGEKPVGKQCPGMCMAAWPVIAAVHRKPLAPTLHSLISCPPQARSKTLLQGFLPAVPCYVPPSCPMVSATAVH